MKFKNILKEVLLPKIWIEIIKIDNHPYYTIKGNTYEIKDMIKNSGFQFMYKIKLWHTHLFNNIKNLEKMYKEKYGVTINLTKNINYRGYNKRKIENLPKI